MAMTEIALVFLGALATLATLGIFADFRDVDGQPDPATRVIVTFAAAVLWGVFGLSSFDVIVNATAGSVRSEPIEPLAWTGIALALLTLLYGVYDLIKTMYTRSVESQPELLSE